MIKFFTLGVYGSTEDVFFQKIINNKINIFCDIRYRRGVRGSKYVFVNSKRLQNRLKELNIRYKHLKELAPSKEIRVLQSQIDIQNSKTKKSREILGKKFIKAYKDTYLNSFDFRDLLNYFQELDIKNVALFCVEEKYNACHRSIVGEKLKEIGFEVKHL